MTDNTLVYVSIGFVVLMIICIIIFFAMSSSSKKKKEDEEIDKFIKEMDKLK